jgi:GNAT superfamily N-acetyltransferase
MADQHQPSLTGIEIRSIAPAETTVAAEVLARGMRDNPIHERAFGIDAARRETALLHLFTAVLSTHAVKGVIVGAYSEGTLVGVCSMVPPGRCQLAGFDKLRMIPLLFGAGGAAATWRSLQWANAWAGHDPKQPHWHLGPVGVERRLQGRGIGGALLRAFSERMDRDRAMSYLETDKRENVAIYERFGFRTVAEDRVLGIPNWFMIREAGGRAA